jgi:hypothetical protein
LKPIIEIFRLAQTLIAVFSPDINCSINGVENYNSSEGICNTNITIRYYIKKAINPVTNNNFNRIVVENININGHLSSMFSR